MKLIKPLKPLKVKWGTCGDDNHWCSFEKPELPLKNDPLGYTLSGMREVQIVLFV